MTSRFDPELLVKIQSLEAAAGTIAPDRVKRLKILGNAILRQFDEHGRSKIIFICTHNSRRSQLAELWLRTAALYYAIEGLEVFSGGTEATGFHPNMVEAIRRFGFTVQSESPIPPRNPVYHISCSGELIQPEKMFSKVYDAPVNPGSGFIAVMVCSDAERNCPLVPGASARISMPYDDPKGADGTPGESRAYDDKVREIGREILCVARTIRDKLPRP